MSVIPLAHARTLRLKQIGPLAGWVAGSFSFNIPVIILNAGARDIQRNDRRCVEIQRRQFVCIIVPIELVIRWVCCLWRIRGWRNEAARERVGPLTGRVAGKCSFNITVVIGVCRARQRSDWLRVESQRRQCERIIVPV